MAVGLSDTTIHTQARQSSRRGLGTIIKQKPLAFLLVALIFLDYFIKNSAVVRCGTNSGTKGRDSGHCTV
jgi:hypothetical protein